MRFGFSGTHFKGEGTVGTNTTFSLIKLPDREDPGDEISGDPGEERVSIGEGDRLAGDETDGEPGGVSLSIAEKILRGPVRDEHDSEPSSLAASRLERRDGLSFASTPAPEHGDP